MKVLVDTCVWSLALRRTNKPTDSLDTVLVDELKELIQEVRVQLIGAVRQEILSGIKTPKQFELLRTHLSVFPDMALSENDYELAARYFNELRSKGIQGSNTDFLICAVSTNHQMPIFTNDKDFYRFSQHIPLALHKPRL